MAGRRRREDRLCQTRSDLRASLSVVQISSQRWIESERKLGEMRGLKIRIADTESQEKSLFPNVITQSKPTETAEMTYCWESLRRGPVWLGRCLNETGALMCGGRCHTDEHKGEGRNRISWVGIVRMRSLVK